MFDPDALRREYAKMCADAVRQHGEDVEQIERAVAASLARLSKEHRQAMMTALDQFLAAELDRPERARSKTH